MRLWVSITLNEKLTLPIQVLQITRNPCMLNNFKWNEWSGWFVVAKKSPYFFTFHTSFKHGLRHIEEAGDLRHENIFFFSGWITPRRTGIESPSFLLLLKEHVCTQTCCLQMVNLIIHLVDLFRVTHSHCFALSSWKQHQHISMSLTTNLCKNAWDPNWEGCCW